MANGVLFGITDVILSASIAGLHGSEALRLRRRMLSLLSLKMRDLVDIVSKGWIIKDENIRVRVDRYIPSVGIVQCYIEDLVTWQRISQTIEGV